MAADTAKSTPGGWHNARTHGVIISDRSHTHTHTHTRTRGNVIAHTER